MYFTKWVDTHAGVLRVVGVRVVRDTSVRRTLCRCAQRRALEKFYATPVLANVPVVEFGEGDFHYNGMRGIAGLTDADKAAVTSALPWLAGTAVAGLLLWAVLR